MTFLHPFLKFFTIANHTGFNHFPKQVVSFTSTLTYPGKYRKTVLFLGNIVDQFLNKHSLPYTSTTEQANLTTFTVWFQQVDNFDTCIEHLLYSSQIFKFRGFAVNGISTGTIQLLHSVNRVTNNIHQTAFNLFSYRHSNRSAQRINFHASL